MKLQLQHLWTHFSGAWTNGNLHTPLRPRHPSPWPQPRALASFSLYLNHAKEIQLCFLFWSLCGSLRSCPEATKVPEIHSMLMQIPLSTNPVGHQYLPANWLPETTADRLGFKSQCRSQLSIIKWRESYANMKGDLDDHSYIPYNFVSLQLLDNWVFHKILELVRNFY